MSPPTYRSKLSGEFIPTIRQGRGEIPALPFPFPVIARPWFERAAAISKFNSTVPTLTVILSALRHPRVGGDRNAVAGFKVFTPLTPLTLGDIHHIFNLVEKKLCKYQPLWWHFATTTENHIAYTGKIAYLGFTTNH